MAQEPPALRPRVAEAPTKARLEAMVGALEALLSDLPPPPLEAPPPQLADALAGSFLHDWRHLDTRQHIHERVRYFRSRTSSAREPIAYAM